MPKPHKRVRRSKEAIRLEKLQKWHWWKTNRVCGFYKCKDCKEVKFCAGNTTESLRCKRCLGLEDHDTAA